MRIEPFTVPAHSEVVKWVDLPPGITPADVAALPVEMMLESQCGKCRAALVRLGPMVWGCPNEPGWRKLLRLYAHAHLRIGVRFVGKVEQSE